MGGTGDDDSNGNEETELEFHVAYEGGLGALTFFWQNAV